MKISRKPCPNCQKILPVFLFTAGRRRAAVGDRVFFDCPHCGSVLKAESSEEHQKNFTWIFLSPLFATPIIFSVKGFVGHSFQWLFVFLAYAVSLLIPTIYGQHKMDIYTSSVEEMEVEIEKKKGGYLG